MVTRIVLGVVALFVLLILRQETSVLVGLLYLVIVLGATFVAIGSGFTVWASYVSAFVVFAQLRGWADELGTPVQFDYAITAERAMFLGKIPTVALQDRFYTFATLGIVELIAVAVYLSYFILPHVLAFALWRRDRERFKAYALAFMGTLYAGLLVSAVLPTAPPWLAGQLDYIPHVYRVLPDIAGELAPGAYQDVYEMAGVNPVAAMPSLHCAIPAVMALALARYPRWRWAGAAYAVAMVFSVVYLGEHYVVDGLAGWMLAAGCWFVATALIAPSDSPRNNRPAVHFPPRRDSHRIRN